MSEKQDALVFRTFNIIVEPLGNIGFGSEVGCSLAVSLIGAPPKPEERGKRYCVMHWLCGKSQ